MTDLPATTRAVVLREFGDPSVLHLEDLPMPSPGPGEVLLRVGAVSINRSFDLRVRQDGDGRGVTLPLVPGADPSGEIVALGPGVDRFAVGDRAAVYRAMPCGVCERCTLGDEDNCLDKQMVGVQRWGGCAEYAVLPACCLLTIPAGLPFAQATIIVRHFPTALALALGRAGLRSGEAVLVMGAAGALGSALIQVARHAGARVLGAAGSDQRVAAAIANGAHGGVNYRAEDLAQAARRFTDGRGVDVVFDNIGDPTLWPGAFNSLRYGGRLATFGSHGGAGVTLDVRRLYSQRLSLLGGATVEPEHLREAVQGALAGRYRALIGAVLPLSEVRRGHEMVAAGEVIGKVILDPNGLTEQ
jgi:NADPH:quinone reductase-like Zn-dependent oxidoreductase